jgi:hypothetical protein
LVRIAEVLQRWTNLLQILLFHQKPLQTSTLCRLISMDHKGSISLLISPLGVNRLFHKNGNSYPTTKTPQKPTQQLHMIPLKDWIRVQGRISQSNIFYFPISPSQKPQNSHKYNKYYFLRMEQITHSSSQDPQNYHTWNATQPFQKSLTQSSFPLCWSLHKNIPNL